MAQIPLIPPTSPDLVATLSNYTAGMSGTTFLNALNNNQDSLEARDREIVSAVEYFAAQFGNGSASGGNITAATGLSVNVAALQAIVGTWVGFDASQAVGGFTASVTNYLFLRQDGTWTVPAAGSSTPPLTTDGHGAYLLWGTVTCSGSAVTSISNTRRTFLQNRAQIPLYTSALSGSIYGDVYGRTDTSTLHIEGLGNFTSGGGGGGTGNMTFQGVYAGGTTYATNDVVIGGDGLGYIAKGSTVGHAPPNVTYWTPLGTQGATGADGATGATGPAGAQGFNWRGAWSSLTTYAAYDLVSYGGSAYIALGATTNNIPSSSPSYWDIYASGGTGATGASGAAGANGSTIYNGSGAPSGGTGVNGDYYFETGGTGDLYYKSAGSWSVIESLTGPQGSTGLQGPAGPGIVQSVTAAFSNGGSVLAVGQYLDIVFEYACTINQNTLLADQSGSLVVDLRKCTYSAFDDSSHPVSGDSICASAKPTISSAVKSQDSTLTGWTTTISAGDIVRAYVSSCTSVTQATLSLKVSRT